MYRSHTCGELRLLDKGKQVQLAGWVQTVRKYGAITFVDLRDRYGVTQLLFGESINDQLDNSPIGREFVIQITGTVIERSNKNAQLPTGDIEIEISLLQNDEAHYVVGDCGNQDRVADVHRGNTQFQLFVNILSRSHNKKILQDFYLLTYLRL